MPESLYDIIARSLLISVEKVTDDLEYNSIPEWDSVAHMALIAELEATCDIMLDTDEIIAMSSVGKIKDILAKHDVAA